MDDALAAVIIAGVLFSMAVVILVAVAAFASPKWFSRSLASAAGGFFGATAAMVAVVVMGCLCSGVALAAILFAISQSVPAG